MELNVGFFDLIKLLGKFVIFKSEQRRLAIHEYEIIDTTYGRVRGMQRKNIYEAYGKYFAFEGIPYAKPPLGDMRFRAPRPPEPWDDVLDCLHYKPKPLQKDFIKKLKLGSEDCLYLNIYAKNLRTKQLFPVMVWICGGGYQVGEASRELYSPDYFMQMDVVLVTLAYRVGALGFLSLSDPDLQIPGNAGLKDQVMALKWIKQNIKNFNGDPNNITLFGESAGGSSVHLLMTIPQTQGLFHRAIMQSGTSLCNWANTPPRDWGYKLACFIGYKGNNNDKAVYQFLAKQNARKLVCKDFVLLTKQEMFENIIFAFGPVVEPYRSDDCITNIPFKDLIPCAWSNHIPVIIGGNSFEGLFHYGTLMKNHFLIDELTDCINLLPDDIKPKHSQQELKTMALKLKQTYFGNKIPSFKESLFEYMDLMSCRTFWHAIFRTVKARSAYAKEVPTYCYVFDYDSEFFNHYRVLNCGKTVRGVSHGDDLSYLFYNVVADKLSPTSAEFKCIERLVSMWYNFALTSNPNCAEIETVHWQAIDNETDLQKPIKVLNINDKLEFKNIPFHDKLQVWNSFYTKTSLY